MSGGNCLVFWKHNYILLIYRLPHICLNLRGTFGRMMYKLYFKLFLLFLNLLSQTHWRNMDMIWSSFVKDGYCVWRSSGNWLYLGILVIQHLHRLKSCIIIFSLLYNRKSIGMCSNFRRFSWSRKFVLFSCLPFNHFFLIVRCFSHWLCLLRVS